MTVLQLSSPVVASPEDSSESPVAQRWKSYTKQNSLKSSFGNRETLSERKVTGLGKGNVPVHCCPFLFCRKWQALQRGRVSLKPSNKSNRNNKVSWKTQPEASMESYNCLREAVPFLPLLPLKGYFLRMKKFPIFTQLKAQIYAWQHKTISWGEVCKRVVTVFVLEQRFSTTGRCGKHGEVANDSPSREIKMENPHWDENRTPGNTMQQLQESKVR